MIRFSEAARQIMERIRESLPEPLVMVIGSGCCEGPVPQLYPASGVPVKGVQVYEEDGLAVYFHEPFRPQPGFHYVIDLEKDVINDTFSLESRYDCQFVLRSSHMIER